MPTKNENDTLRSSTHYTLGKPPINKNKNLHSAVAGRSSAEWPNGDGWSLPCCCYAIGLANFNG